MKYVLKIHIICIHFFISTRILIYIFHAADLNCTMHARFAQFYFILHIVSFSYVNACLKTKKQKWKVSREFFRPYRVEKGKFYKVLNKCTPYTHHMLWKELEYLNLYEDEKWLSVGFYLLSKSKKKKGSKLSVVLVCYP